MATPKTKPHVGASAAPGSNTKAGRGDKDMPQKSSKPISAENQETRRGEKGQA